MHMLRSGAVRAQSCVKVEVDVLGLPVPNSPHGLLWTQNNIELEFRICVRVEVPGLPVLNSPNGLSEH